MLRLPRRIARFLNLKTTGVGYRYTRSSSKVADSNRGDNHRPASSVVLDYWNKLSSYSREPGLEPFSYTSMSKGVGNDPDQSQRVADDTAIRKLISAALKTSKGGDLVPNIITSQTCDLYSSLDLQGKKRFLRILAEHFGNQPSEILNECRRFLEISKDQLKSETARQKSEDSLRFSLEPLYQKFFRQISQQPSGMKFLVDMRADLLAIIQSPGSSAPSDASLRYMNNFLRSQLQEWFSVGFLNLQRLTWQSPANVLEKVIVGEAVHPIETWDNLKPRLGLGRRCYGFFHHSMPDEVLVFVQVALTQAISDNVQNILSKTKTADVRNSDSPQCAIFYSISATQKGLAGVELGNFLIKRVVNELRQEFPTIATFCTLSPLPNFMSWLKTQVKLSTTTKMRSALLSSEEEGGLRKALNETWSGSEVLTKALSRPYWWNEPTIALALKAPLMRLAARYLLLEKRRQFALDPVANFHVRNGACVHRLNWLADVSDKGLAQSAGMMVNYKYILNDIEENNQQYVLDGTIAVESVQLEQLQQQSKVLLASDAPPKL